MKQPQPHDHPNQPSRRQTGAAPLLVDVVLASRDAYPPTPTIAQRIPKEAQAIVDRAIAS